MKFTRYSHITFGNNIYWLSLVPDNAKELHELYHQMSDLIMPFRRDAYDPHLTLFNYRAIEGIKNIAGNVEIEDCFSLALGSCDEYGQVTEILRQVHMM